MENKQNMNIETRKATASRIRNTYPDRIPIIITEIGSILNRKKFLVPKEYTLTKFMFELRNHIKSLQPDKTIYLLLENKLLPRMTDSIEDIYNKHKNEDGFLYLICCEESTFGSINGIEYNKF